MDPNQRGGSSGRKRGRSNSDEGEGEGKESVSPHLLQRLLQRQPADTAPADNAMLRYIAQHGMFLLDYMLSKD